MAEVSDGLCHQNRQMKRRSVPDSNQRQSPDEEPANHQRQYNQPDRSRRQIPDIRCSSSHAPDLRRPQPTVEESGAASLIEARKPVETHGGICLKSSIDRATSDKLSWDVDLLYLAILVVKVSVASQKVLKIFALPFLTIE